MWDFLYLYAGGDISNAGAVDADDTDSDSGAKIGAGVGSGVVAVCAAVVIVIVLIRRKPTWLNKAKYVSKHNGYFRVQVIEKLNISLYLKVVGWNPAATKLY